MNFCPLTETATLSTIYAIYMTPTILSRGHDGLFINATFVEVAEHFLFKMMEIAASTDWHTL